MSSSPGHIFISRVSREFGKTAEDLSSLLQGIGYIGRTQMSFRQEADATTTLSKLSEYITKSDTALSLVGEYSGGYPSDQSLDDCIHPRPRWSKPQKTWRDLMPPDFTRLSYTQWEVILARFWGKPLYFYFGRGHTPDQTPPTADDDLPHQEQFALHLTKDKSLDRDYFANTAELKGLVMRDLWSLQRRVKKWPAWAVSVAAVLLLTALVYFQDKRQEARVEAQRQREETIQQRLEEHHRRDRQDAVDQALTNPAIAALDHYQRKLPQWAADLDMTPQEYEDRVNHYSEAVLSNPQAYEYDRALAFLDQNNYAEAETSALKAKEQDLAFDNPNFDEAADALLTATYAARMQREPVRALVHGREAEKLISQARDPARWLSIQAAIAFARQKSNDSEGAIADFKSAIASAKPALSEESHGLQFARFQLGLLLFESIKYAEAEAEFRALLEGQTPGSDPEEDWTRAARVGIVLTLLFQGKYAEVESEIRAVIAISDRAVGPEDSDTLLARRLLFQTLLSQGRPLEARAEALAVLAIQERLFGSDHALTFTTRSDLSLVLTFEGKYAEAGAESRAILAARERVLGPEHADTLSSRVDLAMNLTLMGKAGEAEPSLRAVIPLQERIFGADDPDTLESRAYLGYNLSEQNKHAEAEVEQRAVTASYERIYGHEHPLTLTIRSDFAGTLCSLGRPAEAETELRAILTARQRTIGPGHLDSLRNHYQRALCLRDLNRRDEALREAETALSGRTKVLGPDHPRTRETRELIDELKRK